MAVASKLSKTRIFRTCPLQYTDLPVAFPNSFLWIFAMAIIALPEYGKRLIPQILDSLASAEPDRVIYSVATSSDISHGLRHISARTFAKAVDKTAWWLYSQLGRPTSIQTVGYIGPRKLERIPLRLSIVIPANLLTTLR